MRAQTNRDGRVQEVRQPVWIEPQSDGNAPLCAALERARLLIATFLVDHPDAHPPLIINVTNGRSSDGDPLPPATRVSSAS